MPAETRPPSTPSPEANGAAAPRAGRRVWPWYSLLGAQFVGMLWVPFYNSVEPKLGGIPFFYWYQFAGIGVGAALTAIVYAATRTPAETPEGRPPR